VAGPLVVVVVAADCSPSPHATVTAPSDTTTSTIPNT
jgi:hypothetical protein